MRRSERILLVHDGDPIGLAAAELIRERGLLLTALPGTTPVDEIVAAAFGCGSIIAIGDRYASHPAILSATEMPGVGSLVVIVRGEPDLSLLRKRGAPYTVLRASVLLEDVLSALRDVTRRGRLLLDADHDVEVRAPAAEDVAVCALAATTVDDVCGRVITLCAPAAVRLSELARRAAEATGHQLTVRRWPKWAMTALRTVGGKAFALPLPCELDDRPLEGGRDLLHQGPWQTPESVALKMERRSEHAMGMQ